MVIILTVSISTFGSSIMCLCHADVEGNDWHKQDFLPLPLSESYKLPSRKQRHGQDSQQSKKQKNNNSQSAAQAPQWLHDKHSWDTDAADPSDDPTDLRSDPGKGLQQTYRDTGLDSSSGEDEEGQVQHISKKPRRHDSSHAISHHAHTQHKTETSKQSQRGNAVAPDGGSGNPFDSLVRSRQTCISPEGQGPGQVQIAPAGQQFNSQLMQSSTTKMSAGAGAEAEAEQQRAGLDQPFDYAAARARAPGLDLALGPAVDRGGRGRGRRGGRGADRGRGRGGRDGRGRG